MPIKDGFQAIPAIRGSEAFQSLAISLKTCPHHPWSYSIFAVSTSLESVQQCMESLDMDGWILKRIDIKRINVRHPQMHDQP